MGQPRAQGLQRNKFKPERSCIRSENEASRNERAERDELQKNKSTMSEKKNEKERGHLKKGTAVFTALTLRR
jgi:hypothetical protein